MMNIGFWNIYKKDNSDVIVQIMIENEIDIMCLAEVKSNQITIDIIKKYSAITNKNLYAIKSTKDKVIFLSRLDYKIFTDLSAKYNSKRLVSFLIELPTKIKINLIGVHFHSKNNWSDISLAMECVTLSNAIKDIEKFTKTTNTILIGDFNMNPFESGLLSTNGLNTISDKEYLKTNKGRLVDNTHYPFFYNPMWNFFGDKKEAKGTFFYRNSGNISYEWNLFDQVLLRPSLIKHLNHDAIKIITKTSTQKLISKFGRPDKKDYSDHLPIILNLNI